MRINKQRLRRRSIGMGIGMLMHEYANGVVLHAHLTWISIATRIGHRIICSQMLEFFHLRTKHIHAAASGYFFGVPAMPLQIIEGALAQPVDYLSMAEVLALCEIAQDEVSVVSQRFSEENELLRLEIRCCFG